MKFFVDLSKKQLIKSAASNVALERVVLKRRDSLAVEVVFVTRNAVATMPAGTTVSVALKKSFSDSNFLASASGTPPVLNLNTVPLEALFSATAPSTITALLEIRWTVPGETTRTATLQAEVQNSVILGTEATPEAIPDGKATQAEAQAGTNNEKWMTPLRTAQAIAVLAPPPTWDAVQNKPTSFPPSAHTHTASQITDFSAAAAAAAPVQSVAGRTGAVTLAASDITGLQAALDTKATLPTDSSHAFSQSGQSLALQPARAQFVRVTMSFANGSASVQLPSSGQNYDEVIVDANVGANCTLTVGSIELANTNQYYGIGRRLLRFVRKNNIWNLYEHPYHTHTTNELIFAAAPQVATSPGRAGTLSYAAGNLYVAVGDNQWRRVALATW